MSGKGYTPAPIRGKLREAEAAWHRRIRRPGQARRNSLSIYGAQRQLTMRAEVFSRPWGVRH